MKRLSVVRLMAMLPMSDTMTRYSLSKQSCAPWARKPAITCRAESTHLITIEVPSGKDAATLYRIDVRAQESAAFTAKDADQIRVMVRELQAYTNYPVLCKSAVYAFLDSLASLGQHQFANNKNLSKILLINTEKSAQHWWNH